MYTYTLTDYDDTFYADVSSMVNALKGNDYVIGSAEADIFYGGRGEDTLYGFGGNDWLDGSFGNDYIEGDDGDDTIYGGAGSDFLSGNRGSDTVYGGNGNDVIDLSRYYLDDVSYDRALGGPGDDELYIGDGAIAGNRGNDILQSTGGNSYLFGGVDDDRLWSGGGVADGFDGNDRIEGIGTTVTYAAGGLGHDLFVGGHDAPFVITDFHNFEGDKIKFNGGENETWNKSAMELIDKNHDGQLSMQDGWDGHNGVWLGGGPTGVAINVMVEDDFIQVWDKTSLSASDFIV